MTTDDEAVVVAYSVKDLFERVDEKLGDIAHKLDAKADRADVDAVKLKILGLETTMLGLRLWRAKLIGVVIGVGLGSGLAGASISRAVLGG